MAVKIVEQVAVNQEEGNDRQSHLPKRYGPKHNRRNLILSYENGHVTDLKKILHTHGDVIQIQLCLVFASSRESLQMTNWGLMFSSITVKYARPEWEL